MLVGRTSPLAHQCSLYWRVGFSTSIVVALILATGALGVRRASAQAPEAARQAEEERAAREREAAAQTAKVAAAEREAAIQRLKVEQEDLRAQLQALEVQKRQLQDQIANRRDADRAEVGRWFEEIQAKQNDAAMQAKIADAKAQAAWKDKVARDKANVDFVEGNFKKDAAARNPFDAPGRPQLDLVSLANSYVDSVGSLQIAEVQMQENQAKRDGAAVRIAQVHVETAKRKMQIFRSIAEAALEAAKADFEFTSQQFNQGLVTRNTLIEAESRIKILQAILAQ